MDFSIEQINDLKRHVRLHVWIYVSLRSPNHTIFRLKEKVCSRGIKTFDKVKDQLENASLFEQYFEGCESVHFVFFSEIFGINILITSIKMLQLLKKINPGTVHFDEITGRLLIFKNFIRNRKILVNLHDPNLHSGEKSLRIRIIRKFMFQKVNTICTFSDFSKSQFEILNHNKIPVISLRLVPYFFYEKMVSRPFKEITKAARETVFLFFGRISPYKGIDELLMAFANLLPVYPNLKLVIAGKGNYVYQVPENLKNSTSLVIINRFIYENEIKSLFEQADVLICPYRDATQSGVIMTARALKLKVIVSNVGALPEYVHDGENGYVYNLSDSKGLEYSIIKFIEKKKQLSMSSLANDYTDLHSNSQKLVSFYNKP
jgi:glycosyltransferase involved in cell wall biosynthesis